MSTLAYWLDLIKKTNILILLILSVTLIVLFGSSYPYVNGISSQIPMQYTNDEQFDWIDVDKNMKSQKGEPSTDLVGVNYHSNGKFFNATLWLGWPFNDSPVEYETLNYGIMVDSDFNNDTGIGGVDYQTELRWSNQSKTWHLVSMEWSSSGQERILSENQNYTDRYKDKYYQRENKTSYFVTLSIDLSDIIYPEKYRIAFYGEAIKNGSLLTDFTKWVTVPPPELIITTSPPLLEIRNGEQKSIEVRINSTQGYEPLVTLNATSDSNSVQLSFEHNKTLRVPSFGLATVPLIIAPSEAPIGPHTIFLFANFTAPKQDFMKVREPSPTMLPISFLPSESETKNTHSSMQLMVQERLGSIDIVSDFWNKLGSPISFFYGVAAGISPWVFSKIRNRLK